MPQFGTRTMPEPLQQVAWSLDNVAFEMSREGRELGAIERLAVFLLVLSLQQRLAPIVF
jgi:hypothetical protein